MVGIKDEDSYKKLLAFLFNSSFQEMIGRFRMKFGIPISGFQDDYEGYINWLQSHNAGNQIINYHFWKIVKRSRYLFSRTDSIFPIIAGIYIVFGKFPKIEELKKNYIPSSIPRIMPSMGLGYVDVVFCLPFEFNFNDVEEALKASEGLLKGFSSNLKDSLNFITRGIEVRVSKKEVDDSLLLTTPGNPADIIDITQDYMEYLVEFGVVLLRESVKNLKSTKIEKYEDKNRHISSSIQQMGTWLLNRGLYNLGEMFWTNITIETDKINKENGLNLNKGISLGNTGVFQLAQKNAKDGLFNLYRAFEEDRIILESLQNPNSNPEKNLVSTILYTQFEDNLIRWLYETILIPHESLSDIIFSIEEIKAIIQSLSPDKRLVFFGIIFEFNISYNQKTTLSNFLSRGDVIKGLSDISIFIEDEMRRKAKAKDIYNFITKHVKLATFKTRAESLDELVDFIKKTKATQKGKLEINSSILILIRNYSGHNYDSSKHVFFDKADEYFARIIFVLFTMKKEGKL